MSTDERAMFIGAWQARVGAAPREFDLPALAAIDAAATVRAQVGVVSMGNRAEAHSSAMAPDIDDRVGIHVATRVADATGARYLGHCPFATDRLGGLAQVWSPACESVDQFLAKTHEFLARLLAVTGPVAEVWLLSGHGGNGAIEPHLPRLAEALGLTRLAYHLALRVPPELPHLNTQHAGDLEHSVAKALGPGAFDQAAFDRLCARLATDVEGVLRDEPALGGMAGYYLLGDDRFAPMRARYPGVKSSVRALVEGRTLTADAELGRRVLEHTVASLAAELRASPR
ncbi:MAG: hypothetical protein R3B06_25655 [Kofleriaceae bacterium]